MERATGSPRGRAARDVTLETAPVADPVKDSEMVHEEARVAETRIPDLAMAGAEAKAVDLSADSRMDCARVSSMAERRAGGEMVRGQGRAAVCRALLATIQETEANSAD